jgi:hypothetical protein
MDRERVGIVLVAFACVLAVATAASTLASPAQPATDAGGDVLQSNDPSSDEQGSGGADTADAVGEPGDLTLDVGTCLPWLYSGPFWTGVAVVAMGVWLAVARQRDAVAATAVVSLLALPFTFAWLVLTKCGTDTESRETLLTSDLVATPAGGDAAPGLLGDVGVGGVPLWVVGVLAVVGIGAVALATTRSDDGETDAVDDADDEGDDPPKPHVEGLEATAARAADRIQRDADVDNEIYRAWIELTEHLDVAHPDASTPGEFADAAVDAGLDPDTVAELTELFERVRYGDTAPTADREDRAVAALRAVETDASQLEDFWGDSE